MIKMQQLRMAEGEIRLAPSSKSTYVIHIIQKHQERRNLTYLMVFSTPAPRVHKPNLYRKFSVPRRRCRGYPEQESGGTVAPRSCKLFSGLLSITPSKISLFRIGIPIPFMANVPQESSPRSMRFVLARAGFVLAAFLLTLYFGRILLTRPPFLSDDESYLLLSLKHYFAGEHLYTQVTSQYGPFYYIVQKAFFGLLRLPVTYDAGRLVTYIYWILSSVFGGLFIYRLSKSVTVASAACLATMWLERVLSFEPNHPEEVVLVLLTAGCLVSVNPSPVALMLLGAIGAALVFTKINIGILFLAAALIASVCVLPAGRLRNIGGKVLIVAMVAGPLVLMHHFLSAWARGFCLIGILAGVSVVLAGMHAEAFSPERMRALQFIAVGALAAAILIVLETTVEGLPLNGLLYGVVLGPLHHPDVFSIPFVVTKKIALPAVLLSLGMTGLYCFPGRRSGRSNWIGALKCLVGILVVGIWVQRNIDYTIPPSFSFAFAPAYVLLPVVLLPKMGARWTLSEFFPRIFVTALAATQMLQSFPVAGSQVNIGAAPFLLGVCLHPRWRRIVRFVSNHKEGASSHRRNLCNWSHLGAHHRGKDGANRDPAAA